MFPQVGILGIGSYFPDPPRLNSWWPAATVTVWESRLENLFGRAARSLERNPTPGEQLGIDAIRAGRNDPFQGCKQRYVMPDTMVSSDMEALAIQDALQKVGLKPTDIDCLLVHSVVPDHNEVNCAAITHHKVGLAPGCFALSVEGTCNSFLMQLHLAEQLIRTGKSKYALLVQSSGVSRLLDPEDPSSAYLGDGAAAVVVGRVADKHGLITTEFYNDGTLHGAFVAGVPGKRWYDEGRVIAYSSDRSASHRMILQIPDVCKTLVHRGLTQAHLQPTDVDFFACHQPTAWHRRVAQQFAGLTHAHAIDTFAFLGNLSSVNIATQLAHGIKENALRDGHIVTLFGVASGMTCAATILRWGH